MSTETSPLFSGPGRRSRLSNEANGFTPSETSNSSTESDRPLNNKKRLVFSNPRARGVSKGGTPKLPLWRKLMFAIGSMPYAMCNTVVGFYLNIFLLEVAILDPLYVLIIVFSGRVWDAITDPFVGYLCSRTKTRFGRLRPWMITAALPAGVVYLLLWFVPPPFDHQRAYVKFIYYLVFYFAFQALLTCIHVPYTALTMHLSHDNKERDSATLYRMIFEVLGTLLGILVYTLFYLGFVHSAKNDCTDGEQREGDPAVRAAYRYHAMTLGILVFLFILTTFIGVREQKEEVDTDKKIGFFKGLRETITFKPYLMLLLMEMFAWLAVQFVQGNAALYIKYSVAGGVEDQYPYVIALLLVSTVMFMPFWQLIIVKIGKKTAFFMGMWILLPMQVAYLFIPFFPYSMYPLAIIGGMGVSCAYLLPWSMLPDVIDQAALERGVRREELFYAFFVFGNKFAGGVTLGISTGVYKIAGYDENQCEQPWAVSLTLKLLMSVPSIIFILISLVFLHFYPINETSRERTKHLLQERRKQSRSYNGHYSYTRKPSSITIVGFKDQQEENSIEISENGSRRQIKKSDYNSQTGL